MEKGFYHPDLGYWQTISEPTEETIAKYPEGTIEVPLKPSKLHKFVDGGWQAPTQAEIDEDEAREVRAKRNITLAMEVDPIVSNPLRWNSMTAEQQQAWADYRQALLDITTQETFPNSVTWPTKPE